MGGRPWPPRVSSSRTGSRQSSPAAIGGRKKGDDAAPAGLAPADRGRLGPHPRSLAGHPPRLRLGAWRGPNPEQRGRSRRGRGRLAGLVAAIGRHRAKAGTLAGAVDHFLKVTRSYRPGLFHGYAVADLPRTNNDLEQLFGSYRRHERRVTGRKVSSSATVLRGPVRVVAALATRLRDRDARDLAGVDRQRWREVRAGLERRRHARVLRAQFRRDPAAYLSRLEQLLRQPALPA